MKTELGADLPGERLSDQAAPDADLPLEGLLQPAVGRDADQEPGAPGRLDLQEDGAARGADDSRLRPHDGQPRAVAVRSAERRGLGRRRTWITPATLLQRGNLFRDVLFPDVRNFRPPDRAMSATDARVGERLAKGMNITEATKERRRRVEHDGRPRRGLQHALRRLHGLPARLRADEADSARPRRRSI